MSDHAATGSPPTTPSTACRVVARFAGGHTAACDLLVCADGNQSTARRLLLPEVTPDTPAVGWRGTVFDADRRDAFGSLPEAITYFVMPHRDILAYPIPGTRGAPHQAPLNWVWYRNVPEGQQLAELMTDRGGTLRSVSLGPGQVQPDHQRRLRDTARACLPPPLAALVSATAEPFLQAVFDIEVPRMAFGRVCLIGDAAFALRPHAAAGTAKAAEDAWTLGQAVHASAGDVVAALDRWQTGQLTLGRQVLNRARSAGDRFQFENTWRVGEPLPLGLYQVSDNSLP
jgi:2,6-dihydroxypyridine 3-monooxygenase